MSATSSPIDLVPAAATQPRRQAHGPDRAGLWMAGAFAMLLSFARLIDVTESGPAMMLFGMLFTAAVSVTALLRPKWFPLLAAAYLPFSSAYSVGLAGVPGANMINIVIALGAVACVVSLRAQRQPFRLGRVGRLVVLYIALASLSVLPSMAAGMGTGQVLQLFREWVAPILFFFATLALVRERQDVADLLEVIAWTAALVAGLTLVEGVGRMGRGTIDASRVPGLMGQANSMGAFLVYYGVPLLALALATKSWPRRAAYLAGYLAAARAILFTFSRGAYLGIAAGSAVVLLIRKPALLVAAMAGGVVAVVLFPGLIPNSVMERLSATAGEDRGIYSSTTEQTLDKSSSHRLILWRGAARMIAQYPTRGVGLGMFEPSIGMYTEVPLLPHDPTDAHNAFILIAGEMGLPTLLVLLLLHATFAVMALRLYYRRRMLIDRTLGLVFLGTHAGVFVSCMLGSRFSDEALIAYFWMFAGLLCAVSAMGDPHASARAKQRPARR